MCRLDIQRHEAHPVTTGGAVGDLYLWLSGPRELSNVGVTSRKITSENCLLSFRSSKDKCFSYLRSPGIKKAEETVSLP